MRGVYYSACSLCYKTIGVTKNICLLLRDGLLFRRLLLLESTVLCYLSGQNFVRGAVNWNSGRVLKELQSHLVSLVGILAADGFCYLLFSYKDIDSFDDQQF